MKIQLDLQALERLIGGDSLMEVELRNYIVQEFTKRHLKAIANGDEMKAYMAKEIGTIKGLIAQELTEAVCDIKKESWGRDSISLKKEIIDNIRTQAGYKVASAIEQAIQEALTSHAVTMKEYIDKKFDKYTAAVVDKLVMDKLSKIVAEA